MFTTLIESKGSRKAHARWLPASTLVHAVLLAGAIAYSPAARGSRAQSPEVPELVWLAPQRLEASTPRSGTGGGGATTTSRAESTLPRFGEAVLVDVPDISSTGFDADVNTGLTATSPVGSNTGSGDSSGGGGPRWASQVEKVALPHPANRPPGYPHILHAASIEGSVIMRFVIDTTGAVEPDSRVVLRTDHPLFTAAVLRALGSHRFLPAETGGRKVRMLVEQRFEFTIGSR